MVEAWRLKYDHPLLGPVYLHNRDGTCWQADVVVVDGYATRLDLQVGGAWTGAQPNVICETGAELIKWARLNEPLLRNCMIETVRAGDFNAKVLKESRVEDLIRTLCGDANSIQLRLHMIVLFATGISIWDYAFDGMLECNRIGIVLDADRIVISPIYAWRSTLS